MSSKTKRIVSLSAVVLVIVAPFVVWTQRWSIYDAIRLRGYNPPAQVAQLATDTAMNDDTRKLFYVYHPDLQDKVAFHNSCKSSEKTIVLGCFVSGTGIYLYNVTDARLAGIIQVTAAHETLHAAYERLSSSEKERVNNLLEDAYTKVTNQRIKDTVNDYRKNGADVSNELHSILGTEVRTLPPELEQYYARYFTNRLKIVAYSEKYEQAFTERKALAEQYFAQMEALKKQIESLNSELDSKKSDLEAQSANLQTQRANVTNAAAFNAQVDSYNRQVAAFNAKVRQVATLIEQYNSYLEKYNVIANEENQLIKAIDSRPDTLQTQ